MPSAVSFLFSRHFKRPTLQDVTRYATEAAAWAAAAFVPVASLSPRWFGPVVLIQTGQIARAHPPPSCARNLPPATALGALTLRSASDAAGREVSVTESSRDNLRSRVGSLGL